MGSLCSQEAERENLRRNIKFDASAKVIADALKFHQTGKPAGTKIENLHSIWPPVNGKPQQDCTLKGPIAETQKGSLSETSNVSAGAFHQAEVTSPVAIVEEDDRTSLSAGPLSPRGSEPHFLPTTFSEKLSLQLPMFTPMTLDQLTPKGKSNPLRLGEDEGLPSTEGGSKEGGSILKNPRSPSNSSSQKKTVKFPRTVIEKSIADDFRSRLGALILDACPHAQSDNTDLARGSLR